MAAPPRFETGPVAGRGKQRRFPWRLWLYAIVMTAGAGAGGYFTWQFRDKKIVAEHELDDCHKKVPDAAKLAECAKNLGAEQDKSKQLERQLAELGKGLDATKDELATLRAQKAEADKRIAAVEAIQKKFAEMISTGTLRVTARRGQLVLSLPSGVLFPSGSAELSKKGEYTVAQIAGLLKDFKDRRFLVVGHTDNQDLKAAKDQPCAIKDNWQLSTERALTVTRVMVTAGMEAKNLLPSGAGEYDPVASNAGEGGRQLNRRIEIALLPAINELPPLPAGLKEEPAPPKP